jgi:predicted nicotinamide N-methyase
VKPDALDPAWFIQAHMRIAPAPSLPEIRLYTAHPASGLWRLVGRGEGDNPLPPYWAYHWAGGTVLARYILDRPKTVAGLRILDLGAGSGVVAIAAAKSGAKAVLAADIDRNAVAAITVNAVANAVSITTICEDITRGAPPAVDLVLVGDLFYGQELADRVAAFLERCVAAGIEVLVGDPGRAHLPLSKLRLLAEYPVADFGTGKEAATKPSAVYSFGSAKA